MVSVGIRSGIDPQEIIQQLKGIRCPSTIRQPGLGVTSCPDAIARVLEKVLKAQAHGDALSPIAKISAIPTGRGQHDKYCPECGSKLEHEGGCVVCRNCGYSKCS